MNYTPKLSDPRVYNRIKHAFGFTHGAFSTTKAQQWSTRVIDEHFGRNDTDIGKFNRQYLINCVNRGYSSSQGVCKEYTLNVSGTQYIQYLLMSKTYISYNSYMNMKESMSENMREHVGDIDADVRDVADTDPSTYKMCKSAVYPSVHDLQKEHVQATTMQAYRKTFKKELATLDFTYTDKSHRLVHKLQHVRREYKVQLLAEAGLQHQYDIECCAPTLLMQYSRKGLNILSNLQYPTIENYIANRSAIRTELAAELDITYEEAKKVINGLFNGAKLAATGFCKIYKELKSDKARMIVLQSNPFVTALRKDINKMWDNMATGGLIAHTKNKNGTVSKNSMKDFRWHVYYEIERRVLDAAIEYLNKTHNKCFLEHDGWSTANPVDITDMTTYISTHAGYSVKLDYEPYITS